MLGTQPCWHHNGKADSAAKSALDLPRAKVSVPYTDFKYLISQYILSTWQDDWNGVVANKLHWQSYRQCRKDEVVLCRARIGHTHLTHSYILKNDPPPQCEHRQCILTFWCSAIISQSSPRSAGPRDILQHHLNLLGTSPPQPPRHHHLNLLGTSPPQPPRHLTTHWNGLPWATGGGGMLGG